MHRTRAKAFRPSSVSCPNRKVCCVLCVKPVKLPFPHTKSPTRSSLLESFSFFPSASPTDVARSNFVYTSVVTLALAFVTLTPNCFARAMMSMRLRDETLWAILGGHVSFQVAWRQPQADGCGFQRDVLGGVGAVVHEQQLDVLDIADEESLVAGGHHEAGLLVGAEADLQVTSWSAKLLPPNVSHT